MDPFQMQPPQAPPLPKPKKPPKPDPAARRLRPLDYVALLLDIEPPAPDANLPPPIGFRFPEPMMMEPTLPPPVAVNPQQTVTPYDIHRARMQRKLGM